MQVSERRLDARLLCSIVAAGLMSFCGVVVETAMNVTFPALMREFSISTSLVQWVTTGYLLVSAVVIPASAYLKRRFATRRLFAAAISLFIAGTVLAAWSPVFVFLLAGRLLQGLATGIALPMMFNIILEQVPARHLGLMIGVGSLITAIAPAVGPPFGGMIVSWFGWRMIFVVLLPVLAVSAVLGVSCIRQAGELTGEAFNAGLYLLLALGFSSLIFACTLAGERGWFGAEVLVLLGICLTALALYRRFSLVTTRPLLRVEIFAYPAFSLSALALFLLNFICLGFGFLIPNYAQLVSHESAFTAGLLLLPGCTLGAFLAPVSGRLLDRLGARRPILLGNAAILCAASCYAFYPGEISARAFAAIYVVFAFGQGFSMGTMMANGLSNLPEPLKSHGNAAVTTLLQLAGAIGTAVIAAIVASAQASCSDLAAATMAGSRHGFLLLAFLALAIACCSLRVFTLASYKNRAKKPQ